MSPEQLGQLMQGAISLRQMKGSELAQQQNYGVDQSNAILRAMEHFQDVQASIDAGNKVTYGSTYTKDGKTYRDKLQGGSVVDTEELGSANKEGKWFRNTATGEAKLISEHESAGPEWELVADPGVAAQRAATTEATQGRLLQQNMQKQETLAKYKLGVEDPKRTIEERKIFADLFNSVSPDMEYVLDPKKGFFGGDKSEFVLRPKLPQTPGTVQPQVASQQYPTPQTQEEFDALPAGSIYIDPDDGKPYRK